jgi:hypothetical protein
MEFKKIPAPATPPQPYVDPETQMKQALRLMAKRMLHGARGVIFIAGSLMLVTGIAGLLYLPELTELHAEYWGTFSDRLTGGRLYWEEWLTFADLFLALFMIGCGWLVLVLPLFSTLVPTLLLTVKIVLSIAFRLMADGIPNIPLTIMQGVLVALGVHAVSEARAYRREVALAREYFRSTAILRLKEARR